MFANTIIIVRKTFFCLLLRLNIFFSLIYVFNTFTFYSTYTYIHFMPHTHTHIYILIYMHFKTVIDTTVNNFFVKDNKMHTIIQPSLDYLWLLSIIVLDSFPYSSKLPVIFCKFSSEEKFSSSATFPHFWLPHYVALHHLFNNICIYDVYSLPFWFH